MQKFLQILAGLVVLALPLTAKAVTYVGSVTATSNAADIIGYAKPVIEPTFSTSEGSSVRILSEGYHWQKKDADGNWVKYSSELGDIAFMEGTYRLLVKVYTISTEFVLADSWKLTVDGVEWTTKKPVNTSSISQAYAYSPEILVTAPIHIYGVFATSDYPDVIGYGKPMEYPDFTMGEGSIPQISIIHLQKADAEGNWSEYEKMEHSTFEAGKYRLKVQVHINEAGNILDNSWKFIVNGIAWTTEKPINGDSFSKGWAYSPDIWVAKPVDNVVATSDYPDVIGYGKPTKMPVFTMADGSIPLVGGIELQKENADGTWSYYKKSEHPVFEEGTYRLRVLLHVNNSEYVLANPWSFTVNGTEWTTEEPINGDSFSKGWACSPGINVEPSGVEIISSDKSGVPSPVYNLQGIKVKPDASDLRGLPAGVYIIGGKKVLLK